MWKTKQIRPEAFNFFNQRNFGFRPAKSLSHFRVVINGVGADKLGRSWFVLIPLE